MKCAILFLLGITATLGANQVWSRQADDPELAKIYKADQDDRTPVKGKLDWEKIGPRDEKRLARIKEILAADGLKTAKDYSRAAMVLQHSSIPDDYLLCHELCVIAVSLGDKDAMWLAAASEDRFLMNIKMPQRFGTQYSSGPDGVFSLYKVGGNTSDSIRKKFKTPTLDEAKLRVKEINKQFGGGG